MPSICVQTYDLPSELYILMYHCLLDILLGIDSQIWLIQNRKIFYFFCPNLFLPWFSPSQCIIITILPVLKMKHQKSSLIYVIFSPSTFPLQILLMLNFKKISNLLSVFCLYCYYCGPRYHLTSWLLRSFSIGFSV